METESPLPSLPWLTRHPAHCSDHKQAALPTLASTSPILRASGAAGGVWPWVHGSTNPRPSPGCDLLTLTELSEKRHNHTLDFIGSSTARRHPQGPYYHPDPHIPQEETEGQSRRAQPRSPRGFGIVMESELGSPKPWTLSTIQVCFPLNSFFPTAGKLPVSPVNLGTYDKVQELSSNMGAATVRCCLPRHSPSPYLPAGHGRTFPMPGSNSQDWGEPSPQAAFGVGPEFLGWAAEAGRWGGLSPRLASSGRQAHSHTHCPAPVPASDARCGPHQRGPQGAAPHCSPGVKNAAS